MAGSDTCTYLESIVVRIVIAIRGVMMFHVSSDCPYEDWSSVARASCGILEQFHFLRDEYGNIGWVCKVPIWVEKGM